MGRCRIPTARVRSTSGVVAGVGGRPPSAVLAAGVLVLVLLAGGCGSDDDSSGGASSSSVDPTPSTTAAGASSTVPTSPDLTGVTVASVNGSAVVVGAGAPEATVEEVAEVEATFTSAIQVGDETWIGSFDALSVVDATGATVAEVAVPDAAGAGVFLFGDERGAWATTSTGVAPVDVETHELGPTSGFGSGPLPAGAQGLAAASELYLVDAAGTAVSRFDGTTLTAVGTLPFAVEGEPVTLATDDALYVADGTSGQVAIIDLATDELSTVDVARPLLAEGGTVEVGRPAGLALGPDGVWATFGLALAEGGTPPDTGEAAGVIDAEGVVAERPPLGEQRVIGAFVGDLALVRGVADLELYDPATETASPVTSDLPGEAVLIAPPPS